MFSRRLLNLIGNRVSVVPQRSLAKKLPKDMKLVVTKFDVEDTMDFINWTFVRDEPIVRAMGIEDTCDLQRYLKRQVDAGTTLKLVNKNCDIVALALCVVSNPKSAQETRTFAECSICDPKTKRLLNLWADIADTNNLFDCFKVREIWDIAILVTATDARKRGFSKLLTQEARQVGKQEGLCITRMDCTSYFSAKLAAGLNFVTLPPRHVMTYRDKKGVPWLTEAPPHPHGHIVIAYDFLT